MALTKPENKDSLGNILLVSVALCLVCSAVVSVAAVSLRPLQEENEKLAKQRNRLLAAGLIAADESDPDTIESVYNARIRTQWLDLATGEPTVPPEPGTKAYDFEAAADDEALSKPIPSQYGVPGNRPDLVPLYQVLGEDGKTVKRVILPVSGKGLWSTLRAYLALDVNLNEQNPRDRFPIAGVTFYEQAETAGLGAEVENPNWQDDWRGRFAFDEEWSPEFRVAKVPAAEGSDAARYQVDALAGATITSDGVEAMINYWLSEDAYGAFLRELTPKLLLENRVSPAAAEKLLDEELERTAG